MAMRGGSGGSGRQHRARTVRLTVLLLCLPILSCSGPGAGLGNGTTGRGPLVLPDGYTGVMAPSKGPTFMTLSGCVEGDEEIEIEIQEVEALEPWSDAELVWKITWPKPARPVQIGSARGTAPRRFTDLPSSGSPRPCGSGANAPVLAVEFPRATSAHIGFEAVRVRYSADGKDYVADYDITLGICAKGVPASAGPCQGAQ
ncbi:hypothetical protein [Nocardioides sp.]|uniref:hypothetical protein n=1 Tax=Nocardioides sp. TaxID=35761 RepID=UPI0027323F22|nr:hypothetical protein [Nocardioides sp.]MDP3890061.1 hypothetical protein [Nocardioides sp.]